MFKIYEEERTIKLKIIVCDVEGSTKLSGTNAEFLSTLVEQTPPIAIGSEVCSTQVDILDVEPNVEPYLAIGWEIEPHDDIESDVEPIVDAYDDAEIISCTISHVPENPIIELNALFPDVCAFRKALRHFAIKNQFEIHTVKSDKQRYIGKYKDSQCPWRIRASRLRDDKTFKVTVLPHEHKCSTTNLKENKMVSISGISDKASDLLTNNPSASAKEVKDKLEGDLNRSNLLLQIRQFTIGRMPMLFDDFAGATKELSEDIV